MCNNRSILKEADQREIAIKKLSERKAQHWDFYK